MKTAIKSYTPAILAMLMIIPASQASATDASVGSRLMVKTSIAEVIGVREIESGKFEQAENGTLFLDEIGDMPYDAQTKLLRVLQEKEFVPVGSNEKLKTNYTIISLKITS